MIWRRSPVRATTPQHELHGVLQVAMGWEATRHFQFSIRGFMHAVPQLYGGPVDVQWNFFRIKPTPPRVGGPVAKAD